MSSNGILQRQATAYGSRLKAGTTLKENDESTKRQLSQIFFRYTTNPECSATWSYSFIAVLLVS
jgi:hypothetical protein